MDKVYWNKFYQSHRLSEGCSPFATFVLQNYLKSSNTLLELGSGNGRDSLYFAKHGISVIALEQVSEEVAYLNKHTKSLALNPAPKFIASDFTKLKDINIAKQYDCIYSRFTLHSIKKEEQDTLLKDCLEYCVNGGILAIEVRGERNSLYKKGDMVANEPKAFIYDNHYRRFLNLELTLRELQSLRYLNGGGEYAFSILYAKEDRGFAPFNGEDDYFIRIIAQKVCL